MSTVTQSTSVNETTEAQDLPYRDVQRVVFPIDGDPDTLPLYVDFNAPSGRATASDGYDMLSLKPEQHGDWIRSRRSIALRQGARVSLGSYFNAFPAAYWRRWTTATQVRLTATLEGRGTVTVYRSNARGNAQRVASVIVQGTEEVALDLSLAPFGDGGWYWFDLAAGSAELLLTEAAWSVPDPGRRRGRITIAITTFNRPDYCVAQMRNLAAAPSTMDRVDEVLFVDQGTDNVVDQPDFEEASGLLGGSLRILRQGNLGGSGGFARGMKEMLDGRSDYVLLLDDDVVIEPEGILRAVDFADLARSRMIVGGHMFNMYEQSVMHSYGERVDEWRFFWGPAPDTYQAHNFAKHTLRESSWLHRRVDVDYNGWWMCLIPRDVIEDVGLPLPLFIKWDDAEYGLRAKANGYPTVSLPGAAVWHVPWTDKDDTIDWQAYYHQRNRWVAALIYSPYDRSGRLLSESFQVDVKHLLSLQYSALELRLQALEDLLEGPQHLHETIGTKLAQIRATRSTFTDARVEKDPGAFPTPRRRKPPKRGKEPTSPRSLTQGLAMAVSGAVRQLRPLSTTADAFPEAAVPAMDARWWRLANLDSALVSTADGTGASWYRRRPEQFRSMFGRSLELHQRLLRRWPELAEEYKRELPTITSADEWAQTFEAASGEHR